MTRLVDLDKAIELIRRKHGRCRGRQPLTLAAKAMQSAFCRRSGLAVLLD